MYASLLVEVAVGRIDPRFEQMHRRSVRRRCRAALKARWAVIV